jgi:hypothetical protein
MIAVIGVHPKSNYKHFGNLDLYDLHRDGFNFAGDIPVIAHPPCAQWSRLKAFSKFSAKDKNLAILCWHYVNQNGGIFEHPAGSSFFDYIGADRTNLLSVNQSWWGFPATKRTYLYFSRCKAIAHPLSFDLVPGGVCDLHSSQRSLMPAAFCKFLIDCVRPIAPHTPCHYSCSPSDFCTGGKCDLMG